MRTVRSLGVVAEPVDAMNGVVRNGLSRFRERCENSIGLMSHAKKNDPGKCQDGPGDEEDLAMLLLGALRIHVVAIPRHVL